MKAKGWRWIFFGITMFLLIATLVIALVIEWEKLRWLFWTTLIVSAVAWLVYLIVYLIKLKGTPQQVEKIKVDDTVSKEIEKVKNDRNNPDNFEVKDRILGRYGGAGGKEPTPVLCLVGVGTELNENRVSIINLNNPEETTRVTGATKEQIDKLKEIIAEYPNPLTTEYTERGFKFGTPYERTTKTIPSTQQERDKLEREKVEKESTV